MSASAPTIVPRQLTSAPHGHILTNTAIWSPTDEWIVYDVRSDPAGSVFDGTRIERVHVATGRTEGLYESRHGACCGVATYHPRLDRVVFILGPEHPTADWQYSACHRRGVIVDANTPGVSRNLDARDLEPPFTPGALRGGSHVHVFSKDGTRVSFTYEDHVLAVSGNDDQDQNQRNIGVSLVGRSVSVPATHERNHSGEAFSVLVSKTVNNPRPGSDEISRAYEDAWVGENGYRQPDGRRQQHALAFLGDVVTTAGETVTELFIVDLPTDITVAGERPLEGTLARRPAPPRGTEQRRLTVTTHRPYPGIQGPRHWPRSTPDGSRIGFLMRDLAGRVQLWTISPHGGAPQQVTELPYDVASAFSWHGDGQHVSFIADGSVWLVNTISQATRRLTTKSGGEFAPRPEACVFSRDGSQIAYMQPVALGGATYNQIFVVDVQLA